MKRGIMTVLMAGALVSTSLAQYTNSDTVAFWDFENSTESSNNIPTDGQPFYSGGSGGAEGTLDAVNAVLMRGWSAGSGPSFSEGVSPFGGFCMHAANQDGYVNNDGNALVPWTADNWTLEAHVYIDEASPTWETFIAKMGASFGGNEGDLYFQRKGIDNNELRINYLPRDSASGADRIIVDGTKTLDPGHWYGIAVVADTTNGTVSLYVDDGSGYALDGQTTGLTNNLGVKSTTYDWAFFRDYWGGGSDTTVGDMDNVRFSDKALSMSELITSPFRFSGFSPTGQSSDPNPSIQATIANHDSDYVSAELFLDGASVATDNTPDPSGTNTISYAASGLSLTTHTAKVVVVGSSPAVTVTNIWTFELTQPPFDSFEITAPADGYWTIGTDVDVEAVVVENFETVASATISLNGGTPVAMASSSDGNTNTLTYSYTGLAHGAYTAAVVVVGSGTEVQTNEVTFDVVQEGVAATNLVHHYNFEEVSGTTVHDIVGGALYDGTIIGTNHSWSTFSGALDLFGGNGSASWNQFGDPTGSGSYVDLPNGMISELGTGPITIEVTYAADDEDAWWQRVYDFGSSSAGEDQSEDGDSYAFLTIHSFGGGPRLGYATNWATGENFALDAPTVVSGQLTHVVWVYDPAGTMSKLYQDGVLTEGEVVKNDPVSLLNDNNNWLGRAQFNDGLLNGQLYDLRIYTGIMTAAEVAERAAAELGTGGPTVTPNITSFAISSGTGTLIWDSEDGITYNILGRSALSDPWGTNSSGIASGGSSTTGSVSAAASAGFFTIEAE